MFLGISQLLAELGLHCQLRSPGRVERSQFGCGRTVGDGAATAAVAIDPGQIKGVKPLPLAQIRSGFTVLSRPGNKNRSG